MPKLKINERSIAHLQHEIHELKVENSKAWAENQNLKSDIQLLNEIMNSVVNNESYWSEKAIESGILKRIKKFIK